MTATQSFKIYDILQKHFKSNDAKAVVEEIETIIDNKFEKEKNSLSTKEDIYRLEQKILEMQATLERRFNAIIMWTIGTGVGMIGVLITIFKLFINK